MNLTSTANQTHSLGQPSSTKAIVSSDKDEEDFQTEADKIHNDNFNFKLKVHMLNKLLDENKGTISADSKVKEDLRSMERKIELSQRRYDRLVRNRRRQKNRVDKGYGAPLGYDGLSKISRNNNIIGKINENSSSNQNDDGMSFSAVERKQKDVEQRFRDQFGSQLLLPASTHQQRSNPVIAQPYTSALPPVAPKFSTLFGGLGNGDGQELKSGRIEELLSSPQLPQITGKNIWNARKTTRFANTNGSTISPPRTPLEENQIGNNTNFKNTINVNNNTNKFLPKFDDLSLTDSDNSFSITEDQEPVNFNRSENTDIGVQNRGIWISDSEYEEFRQLKRMNIRQNQKIEEQENEIYRLRSEIRTKESELDTKFSNNLNNTTNRVDFFSNLRRRKNLQSNSEVNSNRNETIKGLTWIYDSIKSIQGIPPNLLSTFQDCIIDITYNFEQKDLQLNPPVQSSSAIAKVQPLESITESQQLAVYQYELNRTKQRLSDLMFSTEIKSRQIEVYQAANKTRIQLMHSLGLIPPADSNNINNNYNKPLHGNTYNWYSYRNKLLLSNAERQKLQEKFRAAIYYVIAARRFVQRLDDKMIEKDRLRQRLVDLGLNVSGNTRETGQAESVNKLLRF